LLQEVVFQAGDFNPRGGLQLHCKHKRGGGEGDSRGGPQRVETKKDGPPKARIV